MKMTKKIEIEICKGRLKISKEKLGIINTYMIYHPGLLLYIHADTLGFEHRYAVNQTWLVFYDKDNIYIGSVWINSDTDMKKVEQFLEETK